MSVETPHRLTPREERHRGEMEGFETWAWGSDFLRFLFVISGEILTTLPVSCRHPSVTPISEE